MSGRADQIPVQFVRGVGPQLGAVFARQGIRTVSDLLHFYPRTYEDRSGATSPEASALTSGLKTTLTLHVVSQRRSFNPRTRRSVLEVTARDQQERTIRLKWFAAPAGLGQRLKVGSILSVTGTLKTFRGEFEMAHPEIHQQPEGPNPHLGRIVPIYREMEGVPSRVLRTVLDHALSAFASGLEEDLPLELRERYGFPPLPQAVRELHFPQTELTEVSQFRTSAQRRLIFEEFFKLELHLLRQKYRASLVQGPIYGRSPKKGLAEVDALAQRFPFVLTQGQRTCVEEILQDLQSGHPMHRLLQGDVGSGKTAVALLAGGCILAEGGQVALMAPTEILATQHYRNAQRILPEFSVSLLTGRSSAAQRRTLLQELACARPHLVIGTHALIEDPIQFARLDLLIIDEQHRFGVEQRRALKLKGSRALSQPHTLLLSATPIPRTLALTAFGDLEVSTITEAPSGRSPIVTQCLARGRGRETLHQQIAQELTQGRQIYFIYPLVSESDAEGMEDLADATSNARGLAARYPNVRVGLLHGKLHADQKTQVMDDFLHNQIAILVSTTVVEVGVDVPNATVMVVENAERFGLSQLHQLRGRVGRGIWPSRCFFCASVSVSSPSYQRLQILERTQDGFAIARADLEQRGPGQFLGTAQSGSLVFQLANLVRDQEFLLEARQEAERILQEDLELQSDQYAPLRAYFEREGALQEARLKMG